MPNNRWHFDRQIPHIYRKPHNWYADLTVGMPDLIVEVLDLIIEVAKYSVLVEKDLNLMKNGEKGKFVGIYCAVTGKNPMAGVRHSLMVTLRRDQAKPIRFNTPMLASAVKKIVLLVIS